MFFPIGTDRPLRSTPWVNYALITLNVMVFLLTRERVQSPDVRQVAEVLPFYLIPESPKIWQFFTYQFLHGDWMHLLGNMVFLYVFGNPVEDRLGKIGYLSFYLAGGVFAGLGHGLVESAPVIGASGSVAAVSGAFLALFPLSEVTIVYFFFFIGTFRISSRILIGFYIVQNIVFHLIGGGGVAYLAHLAGYATGFLVGMTLLWTRLLPREPYDLLAMIDRYRRRKQFARVTRGGYSPWEGPSKPGEPGGTLPAPLSADEQKAIDLRSRINAALAADRADDAARIYLDLLEHDEKQVLSQQNQLDVANQLMADGRHERAAAAYELFLKTYRSYAQREQIELILGLIYARYLHRRERAVELLCSALPRLDDPGQKQLAEQTLAQVRS